MYVAARSNLRSTGGRLRIANLQDGMRSALGTLCSAWPRTLVFWNQKVTEKCVAAMAYSGTFDAAVDGDAPVGRHGSRSKRSAPAEREHEVVGATRGKQGL
eukprot:4481153-Amphidinium_carterae.1